MTETRGPSPKRRGLSLAALALDLAAPRSQAATARDVLIDGAGIYPESITSSADGTLYIGSLQGTIFRAARGASRATPWIVRDERNGLLSIFGVLADDRSHTLWVCSSPVMLPGGVGSGKASVMGFELTTGVKRGDSALPAPKAICDDIAIAPDGTAYVADIANGEILTLGTTSASLQLFARDHALQGIDGNTFARDGTLYVDNVRSNELMRVDRAADGRFAGLKPLRTSEPIRGPDGLRLIADNRFVLAEARAGRVDEITIAGDHAVVRVLRDGLMSPSSATAVGNVVYAVEGKIEYVIDPRLKGKDPGRFVAYAVPLVDRAVAGRISKP